MNFWKDKVFLKTMLAVAIPIALQNLITSSLNMVDTLMITSLGEASIAAVGLANQVFFLFALINFGIHTGSGIFIAQYWGKEDAKNIRRVLGLSIALSVSAGIVFTSAALFFPEKLMWILIKDKEVVNIGIDYLRVVSLSYIITGIGFAYSMALRSTGRAKIPMKISAISFITNTVFNYLLIFGKFGFPQLGVKGAALATLLARIVEISFILYTVYSNHGPLRSHPRDLIDWDRNFVKRYLLTTSPVILNEGFWSLGQVLYAMAYASIGKEATAAIQLTTNIQNIFFVLARGMANAAAAILGKKIGEGNRDEVYDYAVKFLTLSTLVGLVFGGVMALTPDLTLRIFGKISVELFENSKTLLIIMGLTFFIRTYNSTAIVGVFRGGGDTKFSMILEIGTVWLVGVPLAFLGARVLKLPVYYVFLLVTLEEVVRLLISIPRILSKKWIRDVT